MQNTYRDNISSRINTLTFYNITFSWLWFDSKENWWDSPELIVEWSGIAHEFSASVTGSVREDEDDRWRCYANITITNNEEVNGTLSWVYVNALNITYVDETSEELGVSGNYTMNLLLQPGENLVLNWTITELHACMLQR